MIDAQAILDDFYKSYYERLHGTGLLSSGGNIMHSQLERSRGPTSHFSKTLELGSGNLEHFPYVRHSWDEYVAADIRKPSPKSRASQFWTTPGTRFVEADASDLPFEDQYFDRVVATCLLLHIHDLPKAIAEWQRVKKIPA